MEVDGEPLEPEDENSSYTNGDNGSFDQVNESFDQSNGSFDQSNGSILESNSRIHECDMCDWKGFYNPFLYHKKDAHPGTR